jgi:hypothetical protein
LIFRRVVRLGFADIVERRHGKTRAPTSRLAIVLAVPAAAVGLTSSAALAGSPASSSSAVVRSVAVSAGALLHGKRCRLRRYRRVRAGRRLRVDLV